MWANFEGKARTREETLARINALKWTGWHPAGITLHNTAAPTLAQWVESGPSHDARIRNLESFYENEQGWHAGPHFFVSRNWINWFSNPLLPGVHSRCWNSTRFGIEMVGDFGREEFNSGDGALVRDNAIFLVAALNIKFGFRAEDLTFHKECTLDNHDCPGRKVIKADVIARVKAEMARQAGTPAPTIENPKRFTNITATVFGGPGDGQGGAYGSINWNKPGVALPYRFPSGPRPTVRVFANDRSVDCGTVDVGPHNIDDPYWRVPGGRPRAERQYQNHEHDFKGRLVTNDSGIDLTPGAARALGLPVMWKGKVDWQFLDSAPVVITQDKAGPSATAPIIGAGVVGTAVHLVGQHWLLTIGAALAIGFLLWLWLRNPKQET